jgi:hypothetical protein
LPESRTLRGRTLQRAAPTIAVLALALGACALSPPPVDAPAAAEADTVVGKHFWEVVSFPSGPPCPAPTSLTCSAAGQGFTVEAVEIASASGNVFVRVRLDDGSEGYLPYVVGTSHIAWSSQDPASAERARTARLEAINAKMARMEQEYCTGGALQIGMTKRQAVRAWCFPDRATSTQTAKGTREEWVYAHRGTLYFKDDRLIEIRRLE